MRTVTPTIALATSAVFLAFIGCGDTDVPAGNPPPVAPSNVAFTTNRVPIEFSFPSGWQLNADKHPYDLQCLPAKEDMHVGVFVFRKADFAEKATPSDILWVQINDIKSKRTNFTELEPLQTQEFEDKKVTTATYVGEKGPSRNVYSFSLIEFTADPNKFAVAIQGCQPGDWEKNKPILEAIVRSARHLPDSK